MSSFRELLVAHAPLLLIDAASTRVQVGWFDRQQRGTWTCIETEAGTAIFGAISEIGADLNAAGAFAYCEGPGSILGIRTSAMAIRMWCALADRPVFAYSSLQLVAAALARADVTVIADARRDSWHALNVGSPLRRVPAAELASPTVMPEGFRHWTPLPTGTERVPYAVADMLSRASDADLFRRTDAPDAHLHEEPSYVSWTPQIHRAPPKP